MDEERTRSTTGRNDIAFSRIDGAWQLESVGLCYLAAESGNDVCGLTTCVLRSMGTIGPVTGPDSPGSRHNGSVTVPAALLLDMDGTLVDTEPYWIASEHALVEEFGGTWGHDDAHSIIGFDLLDAAVQLRTRGGVPLEPAAIVERLLDSVISMCAERLLWQPGARELLVGARTANVPCVLVTMSWRRLADAVLDQAPSDAFVGSIAGDEVAAGKPAPDPYLAAAALVGVEPENCVAIEDSPTGVEAALGAGCRTYAVPHLVDVAPRSGLTVIPTLEGISVADLS